jgi:archaellum component FlaC
LTKRIEDIVKQVETLNKDFNKRNNKVVENVSNIIHHCLHDTNEATEELHEIKEILDAEKVNTSNEE